MRQFVNRYDAIMILDRFDCGKADHDDRDNKSYQQRTVRLALAEQHHERDHEHEEEDRSKHEQNHLVGIEPVKKAHDAYLVRPAPGHLDNIVRLRAQSFRARRDPDRGRPFPFPCATPGYAMAAILTVAWA